MKRIFAVASLAFACVLLAPGIADARLGDSARGRGLDVSLGRFSLNAEGFGTLTQATGSWRHTYSQAQGHATLAGQVTCLAVTGNIAIVGGFITESDLPTVIPGDGFLVKVEDFADPGDEADRYTFITGPGSLGPTCPFEIFPPTSPIARGDIEVVASTFPL